MACVVVAEDNLDHQRVIAEVVRRLGHEVVVTGDGRAALEAVSARRPDLLVADVDMPHLDGLELCRAIRADPGLAHTPIVLITAYLLPGDPRLAGTGALEVIGKPFGVPELTAALRRHLDASAAAPPAEPGDPELFLEPLLDCLDAGLAVSDRDGRLIRVNGVLRELLGAGVAEVPLSEFAEKFALRRPDGSPLPAAELPMTRALAGEDVRGTDLLVHDESGRPRWFAVNARPVRAPGGEVIGAAAAMHDVTTEHRNKQYQQCENEVLKVIAAHPDAADAIERILTVIGTTLSWPYVRLWLVDEVADVLRPAGIYTAPGEPALPLPSAMTRGAGLAGRCWEAGELVWVPDVHAADSPVLPYIATATHYRSAGAVPVRAGDRLIGVLTFFLNLRLPADPPLSLLLTGLAGLVGAFLEQRRAEVLALHLAAATDEYIALVGHELRTPLTSIGAYVDLIAESPDDARVGEVRDLLEVVQRNNVRLRELVEKLLDLAALESGHAQLTMRPTDLTEVVSAAVEAIRPQAGEQRITVQATLPERLVVPGDAERLRQVVDALLGNAVKFSRPDSTVTVVLDDEHGDVAALTVADHGVGVAPAEQARLFRRLYRGGNARHTGIPGSGLGLALARVVVERHRGTIALASQEAAGTTVTIRLPI